MSSNTRLGQQHNTKALSSNGIRFNIVKATQLLLANTPPSHQCSRAMEYTVATEKYPKKETRPRAITRATSPYTYYNACAVTSHPNTPLSNRSNFNSDCSRAMEYNHHSETSLCKDNRCLFACGFQQSWSTFS